MKKIISFLIAVTCVTGSIAFAAPTPEETASPEEDMVVTETAAPEAEPASEPEAETEPAAVPEAESTAATPISEVIPDREKATEFVLDIYVQQHRHTLSTNAVIELYNSKNELVGSSLRYVGFDTPSVQMTFNVPEYRIGEQFTIKLVEGLRSMQYYDEVAGIGESIQVQTYGYINDEGEYVQNNGAAITGNPYYDKEIHLYVTNQWYNNLDPYARIVDGVVMAPVRPVAEAMGLSVKYNPEWDSVTLSLENQTCVFWANNEYMTYPGGDKNALHPPVYIEGSLFVPLEDLAAAYECTYEATDYGENYDVLIGEAPYHQVIRNRIPVNKYGIGSRTNYLIWVSKHEYKVRVYQGQQYHWTLLREAPCALGAWDTPTITGQFEVLERTRWDYPGYYVAPVLRFYNGYALHSTLLSYGGGEYDGRVGVNISHGCVRLHPADINWINSTVPFGTRVYITE